MFPMLRRMNPSKLPSWLRAFVKFVYSFIASWYNSFFSNMVARFSAAQNLKFVLLVDGSWLFSSMNRSKYFCLVTASLALSRASVNFFSLANTADSSIKALISSSYLANLALGVIGLSSRANIWLNFSAVDPKLLVRWNPADAFEVIGLISPPLIAVIPLLAAVLGLFPDAVYIPVAPDITHNYYSDIHDLENRGLGFGVWGLGFGVWGLGFGVWGLGVGGWGVGFGGWGLGVGGWGLRC